MTFEPKVNRLDTITEYKQRKEELSENTQVRRPIGRIDKSFGAKRKKHGGRKKKYTPTRMRNEINKYFERCEEVDEVPSIKGMMIFLKMHQDMFYTYVKYPEFNELLEHARMIIADWTETDVYETKGMAAGKIAYMKNIHGWSDKIESKSEVQQTVRTVDEARAKIEALAPRLLEILQSHETVKQIANVEDAEFVEEKDNGM